MRQVQEGVPLPPPKRVRQRPRSRYPFETLEVGEVFFVPHRPRNNLAPYVSTQGKRDQDWLSIDPRHDGRGNPYFWVAFGRGAISEARPGTDLRHASMVGARPVGLST